MTIAIDPEVLQNARLARVLTCANCHMDVAHENIVTELGFVACKHRFRFCRVCRAVLSPDVIQALGAAHDEDCKRKILAPAEAG